VPADLQSMRATVRTGLPAVLQPSAVPTTVLAIVFTDVRPDAVPTAGVLATVAVAAQAPWTHDTDRGRSLHDRGLDHLAA
jgi:hypothetical protein